MSEVLSIEEWRPVVGYEGNYEVSNLGRVRSTTIRVKGPHGSTQWRNGVILIPSNIGPYPIVGLCRNAKSKTVRIHKLVLEAFVGPCPAGMEARHFPDSDRNNNRLDNLQWGTKQENMADKEIQGTHQFGERNCMAKLTKDDVLEILRLVHSGNSQSSVASRFGVKQQAISKIITGKRWRHVQS